MAGLSSFPTSLDSITNRTDNVDDVLAAHINLCNDAIESIEAKLGIDSSAVVTSIEYILKNASSQNPGHKHNLSTGATDVTATAGEINSVVDGCTATATEINTVCDGTNLLTFTLPASTTISAFGKTIVDDADAAAVRTTIGCPSDPAAGTAGLRTIGTGALTACAGNDSRLSNCRTPCDGSVTVGKLGAAAVAQAKLKTSQGSVSVTGSSGHFTLPGGEYGFYPRLKGSHNNTPRTLHATLANSYTTTTSYVTLIYLDSPTTNEIGYAQQRYITASGEIHWIFILRDKITKKVVSMCQAPDHPCFGNGGKPQLVAHPFGDFNIKTQEIIVINPPREMIEEMMEMAITPDVNNLTINGIKSYENDDMCEFEDQNGLWVMKKSEVIDLNKSRGIHSAIRFKIVRSDRCILQVITEDFDIDDIEKKTIPWTETPVTVELPKIYNGKIMDAGKWKEMPEGIPIDPIKSKIPRPKTIITRKLKKH